MVAIGDKLINYFVSDRIFSDHTSIHQRPQEFIDFWHTNILFNKDQVLLLPTTPGAALLLNTSASKLLKYRTSLLALTTPASLTKAPQISLPYLSSDLAPW